jgi:WD40 repeat protein
LLGHSGTVWGVALSREGQLLASGGTDRTVCLWETGVGRQLALLPGHTRGAWRVALSADGRLVASGGVSDGFVRLWETATGQPLATLPGPHRGDLGIGALRRRATPGQRRDRWDRAALGIRRAPERDWRPVVIVRGHTSAVWSVALSADRGILASGGADETVQLLDFRTGVGQRR